MDVSDVEETIWLERTPCFIWTPGLEPTVVEKTLNTADLVPTLLNLLGVETEIPYMGSDAFDPEYPGFVPFSNGSWIRDGVAYDAASGKLLYRGNTAGPITEEYKTQMIQKVQEFTRINNLILETNYYGRFGDPA